MKLLYISLFVAVTGFTAIQSFEATNQTATVAEKLGKPVFVYSTPVKPYKVITEVKLTGAGMVNMPEDYQELAVKKAYKTNIPFDAVILKGKAMDVVELIQFENK